MRVCGIIAEYNPLHNGHAYHIARARELTGCDFVIAAMSGSFVQRGEPAAFDKWERARWALLSGADLVLELPSVYCLQSAEGFATGGVKLLHSTGVVTDLCFGSECADLHALQELANARENESEAYAIRLNEHLTQGKSFPRAQADALAETLPHQSKLLVSPNFLLGVEYLRAISAFAPTIRPVAVERTGCGYNDETTNSPFASAKAIRRALSDGSEKSAVAQSIPSFVDIARRQPATLEALANLLLYRLRTASAETLRALPDVSEGFENVLLSASEETDLTDLLSRLKSKRYTMARIKRILCCLLLEITRQDTANAKQADSPGYLRLLGMRKEAAPLLSAIDRKSSCPFITKKADMDALSGLAKKLLQTDLRASDIQALAFSDAKHRAAKRDYTERMIVIGSR